MSAAKHTPGPWRSVDMGQHTTRIIDADSNVIADVYGELNKPISAKQRTIHAALIASAPDLVAERGALRAQVQELRVALQALLSAPIIYEGNDYETIAESTLDSVAPLAAKAEAALARVQP